MTNHGDVAAIGARVASGEPAVTPTEIADTWAEARAGLVDPHGGPT